MACIRDPASSVRPCDSSQRGADACNDEHRAPSEGRDDQIAEQRGHRESRHHQEHHHRQPAPARLRRNEFRQRRIADDDFGAEAEALEEAADDQLIHVLRERRRQRRQPEDQEVDLVGEPSSKLVTNKSGDQRSQRHADKGQRNELQVLRNGRELGLDCGGQHAASDIEVVAVEEHAGADQPENPVVK